MKKYIRIDDAIYEWAKVRPVVWKDLPGGGTEEVKLSEKKAIDLFGYKILAQADDIRELCDEFVFEDWEEMHVCDLYKTQEYIEAKGTDKDGFGELVSLLNSAKADQYIYFKGYGAIWVKGEGLICIAETYETDKEGEWALKLTRGG